PEHQTLPSAHRTDCASSSCLSPRLELVLDALLQRLSLLGRQIRHLVLVVQCEQPELRTAHPVVIDHPQTAALALGPACVAESQLAQASRAPDHLARFWIRHQGFLKAAEALVIQVGLAASLESRQFDEDRMHRAMYYTQLAYSCKFSESQSTN